MGEENAGEKATWWPTLAGIREWLGKWGWPGVAIVATLAFVLSFVRPFEQVLNLDAEDVASAWNESIQRLGLMPLYPPTEDFYVGDVWAVIVKQEGDKATREQDRTTLVGRSVRIGYLDLRKEMKAARLRQPTFAETVELESGKSFRKLDPLEIKDANDGDRIAVTLAAFPGVTITHRTGSSASFGWNLIGLGAARDGDEIEEIRIPVAESYGVGSASAFLRLDEWCADAKTRIYCTDEYVRRVLAFSVHDGVLSTKDGKYTTRIQLRLVNRVFLTREIQHRRLLAAAGGAGAQIGAGGARSEANPSETTTSTDTLSQRVTDSANVVRRAAEPPQPGAAAVSRLSYLNAGGSNIAINEVFQRPVAFGFRAISVDLEPSQPKQGSNR